MEKEATVHMLPTEDEMPYNIIKYLSGKLEYLLPGEIGYIKEKVSNQHLYITTDEEIKEGDWYYAKAWNDVFQNTDGVQGFGTKKIIATTDPKLELYTPGIMGLQGEPLPQPSQAFIEEYCKQGGIDKVLVEYECLTSTNTIVLDFSKVTADEAIKSDGKCIESRLKVDSNNCIIIHPVEEKMVPLSQVTDLMVKFSNDLANWKLPKGPVADWLNEWIKENL